MRGLDAFQAMRTNEGMVAEKRGAADQHFQDVADDTGTNQFGMYQPETPPVTVVEKDVPEFNMTADEFHDGNILE